MTSDISNRSAFARHFWLQSPIPIGLQIKPVLQVGTVERENFTQLPFLNHLSGMLDERIIAIVKVDRMNQTRSFGQLHKFTTLCTGHRQWFFTDHMLPSGKNVFVHLIVQMVRRAVVNHLNLGVRQQFPVITVGLFNEQEVGLTASQFGIGLSEGYKFDISKSSASFDMCRTDKPGTDNSGCNSLRHRCTLLQLLDKNPTHSKSLNGKDAILYLGRVV